MALNRFDAALLLTDHLGETLTTVGLTTEDEIGGVKEPLDRTFLALGTAYADLDDATVEDGDVERFLAIGTLFVLRRARQAANGLADVTATGLGVSKRQSQIVSHLDAALRDAELAAAGYGVAGVVPAMVSGSFSLDLIDAEVWV